MKEIQSYTSHDQEGILLNANESTIQFDDSILQEIQQAISKISWNRYPDTDCKELKKLYANIIHQSPEQILVGNGSDQMLGIMIGSFLGKGKTLYTLDPDFSMYDYYASMYDADIIKHKVSFFNVDAFIEEGLKKKVDLVVLSNPNNPTGMTLSVDELKKIITAFSNIPVLIDEAYAEFSQESVIDLVNTYSNLYVTRTLSKAYALASIRVGFLISNSDNIARMQKKMVPYSVSTIDQTVASIVLKHSQMFQDEIQRIVQVRQDWLEKAKSMHSLKIWDSQANFFMVETQWIDDLLQRFEQKNIKIRKFKDKEYCRITIGNTAQNEIVWQILETFEEDHYANSTNHS